MSRTDVLFVIPTNVPDIASGRVKDAIEPPAKARFMAAYLMRRACGVELFDSNLLDYTPEQMADEVATVHPHLVVMPVYGFNPSASTQTMPSARLFAEAIKRRVPEIPIMMSGTHPAAIPAHTLMTESAVDYVCAGEGPITVHELLEALKTGGAITDIRRVRSLWYREEEGIAHNAPAPVIDLNEEPVSHDAWRLMDPRKYRAHHWHAFYHGWEERGPYANPYSREGCPFHCEFCNIQAPYREGEEVLRQTGLSKPGVNSFRTLAPKLFVDEITYLAEEYGTKLFKIPDEMFGLGDHPLEVAKLLAERFGPDDLNFWCYYRVDTCKPKHLDVLRRAGFRWLGLGIEAANSKVRSGQDKQFDENQIHEVVRRLHEAGLEGGLNYIFGLPGDTMESMQETFDLACELNGAYGNFYCAQALPGSELYRRAKVQGYPLPERSGGPGWPGHAQYSYESEPFYEGSVLTPAEIIRFRDEAQVKYYERPEYLTKLASDPKFGSTALQNISEWVGTIRSLKRNLLHGRSFAELPPEE